jgi:hypothetical protein
MVERSELRDRFGKELAQERPGVRAFAKSIERDAVQRKCPLRHGKQERRHGSSGIHALFFIYYGQGIAERFFLKRKNDCVVSIEELHIVQNKKVGMIQDFLQL